MKKYKKSFEKRLAEAGYKHYEQDIFLDALKKRKSRRVFSKEREIDDLQFTTRCAD